MKKKKQRTMIITTLRKHWKPVLLALGVAILVLPLTAALAFELAYRGRVYPGVVLAATFQRLESNRAVITAGDREWPVTAAQLGARLDRAATEQRLLSVGRDRDVTGNWEQKLRAWRRGIVVEPVTVFDQTQLDRLVASISATVNVPVQQPKFKIQSGKVVEFAPGTSGREVDESELASRIIDAVLKPHETAVSLSVDVPTRTIEPTTDASGQSAESLGIKTLLGTGVSTFRHSIASRKHNVLLTAARLDGTLVPPGAIFSFNESIGDISAETGYQSAYIIKDGRTVLGDGGGVCQDSTTVFRAILNAGLPIIERHAHSYRVTYYEQNSPPGLDATVYAPTVDLKFKNDTPAYLLVQARGDAQTDTLTVQIWGTSDGRIATVSTPVVTNQTPPPPDLYQDDPTLPAETVKQVDWKAWGAHVSFTYHVTRQGETLINRVFSSTYQPWQAVFLRGTGSN